MTEMDIIDRRTAIIKIVFGVLGVGAVAAGLVGMEGQTASGEAKEYDLDMAKFFWEKCKEMTVAIENMRKQGVEIPTSAEDKATFYAASPDNPAVSMGFRENETSDWTTIYAGEGPGGPWFQLVLNKLTRDDKGNTIGISIVPLFQYGKRGDGFDSNGW